MAQRENASATAMQKAYMDAQGDPDQMLKLAAQYGASPKDMMSAQNMLLERQQKLMGMRKDQLETEKSVVGLIGQHAQAVLNLPPEQRRTALPQSFQDLAQRGVMQPQEAQRALAETSQMSDAQLEQWLKVHSYASVTADKQITNAMKAQEAAVELPLKQAQTQEAQAGTALKQMQTAQGGTSDVAMYISNWLKAKGLPDTPANRLKAHQAYTQETKIAPAQIRISGLAKMRENQVYDTKTGQTTWMDSESLNQANQQEPGRYRVLGLTPEALGQKEATNYFVKGKGGQQLTAFNTAITHLDLLNNLGAALNNTNLQIVNKAKQQWAQQTGSPAPANFEAAKNAMSGEVAAALKASGATDQEIQKVSNTFDRSQSPARLKGAIGTYRQLLNSKRDQLQKQYQAGMSGQPNFGEGQGAQAGYVRIQASDGSLHDIPQQNLDRARQRDPGLKVVQ